MNIQSPILSERFWSKVSVQQKSKCWTWNGAKNNYGYGVLMVDGKSQKASRVAFFLRNGKWPRHACHSCDNPICCNPDHIFDGTHQDNMTDMVLKKRHKADFGENHGGSVLTDSSVIQIRELYKIGNVSQSHLAKQFNCKQSTIWRVLNRKNWTHI